MKARLAQKILKAKLEYQQFERYDYPYTGEQTYKAARRAGIPVRFRDKFCRNWRKVSKAEGKWQMSELLNHK